VHEPATTTRFPDVVEAAVAGRQASFVPDGAVFATKQTVTADLKGRFEAACAEPEPFFEPSRAVYDAVDGTTRKTYHWGDEHGSLLVHGPNAVRAAPAEASPDEPAEEVGRAFGTFDEADVRSRRSGDVDEGTKERLRALGYY
jgi:arylsulfatase A